MARSWLLLSPSVLSRKGWKVSWQEVTTPHHHHCDRWTASWPTSTHVISALCSLPSWSCSPALIWRQQAAGCEIWAEFAPRGQCPEWPGLPQQRSLQQHNCGAERERATPHISISSPTPTLQTTIPGRTLLMCLCLCVGVGEAHARLLSNHRQQQQQHTWAVRRCLLTSHNTTAQFRSRRQTQRQPGLLYVTTFHFYIAKYVASSGGAREQPNIFCPHPWAVVVVVPSLEILHHQPQYCPKQQKKDHNNIHKSNWYDCINILVMLLLSKWIHASSPSAVCFDIDEKDWQ